MNHTTPITSLRDGAKLLRSLHDNEKILILTDVWDAASAAVVTGIPETRAVATASHAIAAVHGHEDGERIPLPLMLDSTPEIVGATNLPVTADLEAGFGNTAETVRRAIGVGVVGGNIDDSPRTLPDAVREVEAAVRAGDAEGVPFVLNARTDVLLDEHADPEDAVAEAIVRGRAFLDAGAACVFVPGHVRNKSALSLIAVSIAAAPVATAECLVRGPSVTVTRSTPPTRRPNGTYTSRWRRPPQYGTISLSETRCARTATHGHGTRQPSGASWKTPR